MASHPSSANSEDHSPVEWLLVSVLSVFCLVSVLSPQYLYNLDPVAFQQMPLPQITLELPFPPPLPCPVFQDELYPAEIQSNVQPADANNRSTTPTTRSSPNPPSPPQPVAFLSPKWHTIPQRPYKRKQWDYRPSEPILFQVDGSPGVNMGEALRKQFATLKGRDDLVMRGAKKAFHCRLLVRSLFMISSILQTSLLVHPSSPDIL